MFKKRSRVYCECVNSIFIDISVFHMLFSVVLAVDLSWVYLIPITIRGNSIVAKFRCIYH